jgi:hypothetical protein
MCKKSGPGDEDLHSDSTDSFNVNVPTVLLDLASAPYLFCFGLKISESVQHKLFRLYQSGNMNSTCAVLFSPLYTVWRTVSKDWCWKEVNLTMGHSHSVDRGVDMHCWHSGENDPSRLMGFILHFNGFCQNSTKPW